MPDATTAPDPAIALADRLGWINRRLYSRGITDEAEIDDLLAERETVEASIIAAPPQTLNGVAALLDVLHAREGDIGKLENDAALIAAAKQGLENAQRRGMPS